MEDEDAYKTLYDYGSFEGLAREGHNPYIFVNQLTKAIRKERYELYKKVALCTDQFLDTQTKFTK